MVISQWDGYALRPLTEADTEAFKNLDPGDLACSHGEWLFAAGKETEFVQKALREYSDGTGFRVAIVQGKSLAGTAALRDIDTVSKSAGLSYALGGPYRGRGIMTRACRELIEHAFKQLDLQTVRIMADPANRPSCALADRLGFVKAATRPDFWSSGSQSRSAVEYIKVARP